jgi:hypothetical protein
MSPESAIHGELNAIGVIELLWAGARQWVPQDGIQTAANAAGGQGGLPR